MPPVLGQPDGAPVSSRQPAKVSAPVVGLREKAETAPSFAAAT